MNTTSDTPEIDRWIEQDAPTGFGVEEEGALRAYHDSIGGDETYAIESFEEAYAGKWDSEREFAETLVDDLGIVPNDGPARMYFDYEAWTQDLFMGDYFMTGNGYVFRSL